MAADDRGGISAVCDIKDLQMKEIRVSTDLADFRRLRQALAES
jgi:hypothetical protein